MKNIFDRFLLLFVPKSFKSRGRAVIFLDATTYEQYEALMADCQAKNEEELFKAAISLFEWAVIESKKGRKMASVLPGSSSFHSIDLKLLAALRKENSN